MGKSELALQHAVACRAQYPLIWWITAEDTAQILAGLAALAGRLCRAIAMVGTTTAEAADWAVGWLQAHPGWLLILDNVNNPGDVEPLLGQVTGGHIVITTRRDTGWDKIASPIRLDVLDPGSATDLITARTGGHGEAGQDAVALIAPELGYVPLALDQAAAYMTQTRITPADYLQRLREHPAAMYAAGGEQAQRTIAQVWNITIEAIAAGYPAAITLLHILACYAPDNLPRFILGGRDHPDRLVVDEALGVLASYSMITLTPQAVGMHRLVQAVILARQPPEDESSAFGGDPPLTTALAWLDQALPAGPDSNIAGWPLLRALSPHVDNLAALFPADARPERLARVQREMAFFHDSQGQYDKALGLFESGLAIYEATLGPEHRSTAAALAGLAYAYWRLGRLREALPLEQRALQIAESTLGPDHPNTGRALSNLAATHRDLGEADKALPLQQRALEIAEAALGSDHPSMVIRLGNLAGTYGSLGQADKALPLQQRALEIAEAALGPDHPDTAGALTNLAVIHRDLGQVDKALPLEQRALQITGTSSARPSNDGA